MENLYPHPRHPGSSGRPATAPPCRTGSARGSNPPTAGECFQSGPGSLRAEGEPVAAVHPGFAVTTIVLDDGQELDYYWRHDGVALMGACEFGRAAELQPQTVRLMDLPT